MCFSGFTDGFVCVRLCMNVFLWTHRRVRVSSSLHECFSGLTDGFMCVRLCMKCFSGFTDGFVCVRLCMNVFLWIHRRVRVCLSLHDCVSLDSQTGSCVFVSA